METHPSRFLFFAVLLSFFIPVAMLFSGGNEHRPADKELAITFDGDTVNYTGPLSEKNVGLFLRLVEGKDLKKLVIRSGGGEINAGMDLGSWVFENGIDVVVDGFCMSSCANYVFTAARTKTIREGSIVAWHGNILQQSGMSEEDVRKSVSEAYQRLPQSERRKRKLEDLTRKAVEQMRVYREESVKRQAAFFGRIGVDEAVCRIGNERYGARDFYLLSVRDMARFGITRVQAPKNYEKTDLTPFRSKGKQFDWIKLLDER